MYYRDPKLFMRQAVVDRYVDDIAYVLGVERDALNVVRLPCFSGQGIVFLRELQVAAAKGLVAGSLRVTKNDGSTVDYRTEPEVSTKYCG